MNEPGLQSPPEASSMLPIALEKEYARKSCQGGKSSESQGHLQRLPASLCQRVQLVKSQVIETCKQKWPLGLWSPKGTSILLHAALPDCETPLWHLQAGKYNPITHQFLLRVASQRQQQQDIELAQEAYPYRVIIFFPSVCESCPNPIN